MDERTDMTVFSVVIHSSGPDAVDYCEDCYEIAADTPQSAISAAKRRFSGEILPRWPGLVVEDAFVVPDSVEEFSLCDAIR